MLCLQGAAGYASVLYNNGAPNQANGNEMTAWIQAENFTLSAPATITDVRFWDGEGVYNGSITWQIYADAGGAPGALLYSGNTAADTRTLTGLNVASSFTEYQDDFSIGAVALGAGTYWLGLHNGPLSIVDYDSFYWETTNPNLTTTGMEDATPFGDGWSNAFMLFDNGQTPVPEPSTFLLLGAGLAGVGLLRRRMRK
jgi:hypothetical protein